MLIRSILPSAARGFEHAGAANGRRRLTTNQGSKVFVLRAAQRWWHVKGEECERTHSRTRHRQR
ncbi:methyltransferase [Pseudomonas aeruginosa]|nr:methyltransferase [Pseudomonas aeruginosa]TEF34815.1 methyltransferase [Pseudomonas aeruginosa]